MEPENLRFGGGAAGTILHPLVGVAMVLAIILILVLPRKYAAAPLLVGTFMIPLGQVLVVAGIHFTVLRILVMAGLLRRVVSKSPPAVDAPDSTLKYMDRLTVLWTVASFVVFSVQWMQTQAVIASLGDLLDRLGGFLALRFMIQDRDDLIRTIKVFATICLIMGLCMINEHYTVRNIFGYLGGISLTPQIRDGQIRSQGAFGNYIDAGVFGGVLIPLFIWLWNAGKSRVASALGLFGATAMAITCSASTALLAYASGIFALCFWPLRKRMRTIRWSLVFLLLGLQLVMKAPVWALIARIDLTGSSSSYHRYILVDNCIRHFRDWWLIGSRDYNTWDWDMWDLSNQYVACAFTGGLASMALFIGILSQSFAGIGNARKIVDGDDKQEWLLWCLGSALFATVVAFFGCSYMAQMQMLFFAFLGMIWVAVAQATQPAASVAEVEQESSLSPLVGAVSTSSAVGGTR